MNVTFMYLYFKDKKNSDNCEQMYCSCYILVYLVDRCLSFCTFSFGHCVVCSSLIYGFRCPLWYLQTLLKIKLIFVAFETF